MEGSTVQSPLPEDSSMPPAGNAAVSKQRGSNSPGAQLASVEEVELNPTWGTRVVLPDSLEKAVTVLESESWAPAGKSFVYVLGTAHVSQESCNDVRELIGIVKPDMVFVELCSNRTAILFPEKNVHVPTFNEMFEQWKSGRANAFAVVYSYFLATVAAKLTVMPGEEFRVAYQESLKCGARLTLGDRPVQVTLKRTWAALSRWHKVKLVWDLLIQASSLPDPDELAAMLEELKDSDMLTLAIKEMSKSFPTLLETLVYERDLYMAGSLHAVARRSAAVVAVVGKGHQAGIATHWDEKINMKELMELPKEPPPWFSPTTKRVLLGVAVVGSCLAVWSFRSSHRT